MQIFFSKIILHSHKAYSYSTNSCKVFFLHAGSFYRYQDACETARSAQYRFANFPPPALKASSLPVILIKAIVKHTLGLRISANQPITLNFSSIIIHRQGGNMIKIGYGFASFLYYLPFGTHLHHISALDMQVCSKVE